MLNAKLLQLLKFIVENPKTTIEAIRENIPVFKTTLDYSNTLLVEKKYPISTLRADLRKLHKLEYIRQEDVEVYYTFFGTEKGKEIIGEKNGNKL
jgi:hypothetical protein